MYLSVFLVATFMGFIYQLRTQTIFACAANFYDSDHYIIYCGAGGYGDYEHGAFWFDLEPSARAFAAFRLDFQPPRRRIGSRQHQLGITYSGSLAGRIWFSRKGFSAGSSPKPEST
jgi:hypothetical protein